jgi:hypothetical protein
MSLSLAKRVIATLLILLTSLPNSACTKEKAEALKSAAELFRDQAGPALTMTGDLIEQSFSMPVDSKDDELKKIVNDFNGDLKRDAGKMEKFVSEVLKTGSEADVGKQMVREEMRKLAEEYELFASMFRSLPRGYFFAKDAVAKAEKHSIRLTTRMVKMAATLQNNPMPLTPRRVVVIQKLLAAQVLTDQTARNEAVLLAGKDVIQLRDDERKAKAAAIVQCLKAAEAGKTVTELIHNYAKLTLGDILDLTRDSLALLNSITGGANAEIKGMQTRLEAFIKNKLTNDPLWKDALKDDTDLLALFGN